MGIDWSDIGEVYIHDLRRLFGIINFGCSEQRPYAKSEPDKGYP